MRINCGPTRSERRKAQLEWHRYFAWKPTRVARGDCRWLEVIERRRERTWLERALRDGNEHEIMAAYSATIAAMGWIPDRWEYRAIDAA